MCNSRFLFLLALACVFACAGPDKAPTTGTGAQIDPPEVATSDSAEQISDYIRCILQDRDGNLWFGTTTDGVCRYDGRSLTYFNAAEQLGSDWVNAIVEDARGDLWFATRDGLVQYDGDRFTRYTTKDGLVDDHLWCLMLDRSGILWCGTWQGVSRFDGRAFTTLPIPAADLSKYPYYQDPKKINAIVQDDDDNIWIATNGGGAYRYDGSKLTNYSEKQGLCSAFIGSMLVDRDGRLWFGTRFGGLCACDLRPCSRQAAARSPGWVCPERTRVCSTNNRTARFGPSIPTMVFAGAMARTTPVFRRRTAPASACR
jgi:ligand-binding sensor domain-containing protein